MRKKDISRAIVLGAGASYSYAESPTGLRPPLAKHIIPTYSRLDIYNNRYVLVGSIQEYVNRTRGISPCDFSSWNEDLETFFSEVDEQVATYARRAASPKRLRPEDFSQYLLSSSAYKQLVFLCSSIFNEIQNGPLSIPYMLLASELHADDAVITFNWDTLLDRALAASGIWSPSNGYCIRPAGIFDDQWTYPDAAHDNYNGPLYIKLHGSTNWLTPYHGVRLDSGEQYSASTYAMDQLFVFVKASCKYDTYEGRYSGPYEPFSYCYYPPNLPVARDDTGAGMTSMRMVCAPDLPEHGKYVIDEKDVFSMPLIVPPVRNKQYQRYGNIFSTLWGLSMEVLCECKQLFVIGYSFPITDVATRAMFRESVERNKSLSKLVIIDPYPENVRDLFVNEFGVESSKVEMRKKKFEVRFSHAGPLL